LIGLLLTAMAILLGRESGALLVGERTNSKRVKKLRAIIAEDSRVERVGDLLTMQLGPDEVLVTVDIRFRRGLSVEQIESTIDRIEDRIRQRDPGKVRIYIEADSLKLGLKSPEAA
jgi:divalent metal cation (Fe/Co/Zn/Cd) transporter